MSGFQPAAKSVDVVVIGTGQAGSTIAFRCCAANWRVTIIDWRTFSATSGLRGCDLKKVLVGAAEMPIVFYP